MTDLFARRLVPAIVEVEGVHGEMFTISGPGQGAQGVELASDVNDLYDVPVETIRLQHAYQRGSSYGGHRVGHRIPVFSVYISGRSSREWEDLDSEWRWAWDYGRQSKLWIETEQSRRYLNLSLFEHPKVDLEYDPHGELTVKATMTTVAGDPYWYDERPETRQWINPTNTTGGGWSTGHVEVSNPTTEDIWLYWMLQAYPGARWRLPDFSFGSDKEDAAVAHAARTVVMPEMIAGEHFRVDTNEDTTQLETDLDTQAYLRMNGVRFLYPIPAGTPPFNLPVAVTGAPAGVGAQVRMERPWNRPWGMHRI